MMSIMEYTLVLDVKEKRRGEGGAGGGGDGGR